MTSLARVIRPTVVLGFSLLAAGACRPAEPPLDRAGPASLAEAEEFVLALVNQDREAAGLEPVEWDERAARAARLHAEDMASHGFTGHWGTDGSVPEQRYSEMGGLHFVQENAACYFDGVSRELDPNPIFDREALAKIELAFISEVPPNDGHRRNILTATHNQLGIGLAQPRGIPQPCMAQEFVARYGRYAPLPAEARVGDTVVVAGEVADAIEFGAVGLARAELQQPLAPAELLERTTYRVPEPYALYFPAGFVTPKPVQLDGRRFSVELTLDDRGRPGRYEVSIWGRQPGQQLLSMVSVRTVRVR